MIIVRIDSNQFIHFGMDFLGALQFLPLALLFIGHTEGFPFPWIAGDPNRHLYSGILRQALVKLGYNPHNNTIQKLYYKLIPVGWRYKFDYETSNHENCHLEFTDRIISGIHTEEPAECIARDELRRRTQHGHANHTQINEDTHGLKPTPAYFRRTKKKNVPTKLNPKKTSVRGKGRRTEHVKQSQPPINRSTHPPVIHTAHSEGNVRRLRHLSWFVRR